MFSIIYTYIKMDKVFREPPSENLHPITDKEFNEFIKRKKVLKGEIITN